MIFSNHSYLNYSPHPSPLKHVDKPGGRGHSMMGIVNKRKNRDYIWKFRAYTMVGSVCALSNRVVDEMEFTFHTDLFNWSTCLHDLKQKKRVKPSYIISFEDIWLINKLLWHRHFNKYSPARSNWILGVSFPVEGKKMVLAPPTMSKLSTNNSQRIKALSITNYSILVLTYLFCWQISIAKRKTDTCKSNKNKHTLNYLQIKWKIKWKTHLNLDQA